MKHIKHIEQFNELNKWEETYQDSLPESPDAPPTKSKFDMSPEELDNKLQSIMNIYKYRHLQAIKMKQLKEEYPFIKTDEPYKSIWWKYIKIWYNNLNTLNKDDYSNIIKNVNKKPIHFNKVDASKSRNLN